MNRFKKVAYLLAGILIGGVFFAFIQAESEREISAYMVEQAEVLFGLNFNQAKRDSMLDGLNENLASYKAIREMEIANDIIPAIQFNPIPPGWIPNSEQREINWQSPENVLLPETFDELAFYTLAELAALIRQGDITSLELTQFFLDRLKTFNPKIKAVITFTEERALEEAHRADEELKKGIYRGLLHGIPYATKDLLSLEGYPTTWGAGPYSDQVIDETATVIQRLSDAGAVHLAKLTLGELAWGDVWFGGMTRTPWNTDIGASGSSAGSAATVAGGLIPFSIGSETLGSIVSPSTRNGVTGLRPGYGRVSRYGAMALSWSMDKIGPITRTAEDAAIVFEAMYGPDGLDPTVYDLPFNYEADFDFENLIIGYHASAFELNYPTREFDLQTLEVLKGLGANLVPVELPSPPPGVLNLILAVEAAAAFDDLTRTGMDDELVRQIKNAWPNVLRTARFVPAVEYIQANRVRHLLMQDMTEAIADVDVYITPSFIGGNLLITNLTGHPTVVIPNGFTEDGMPVSITFNGHLFDEGTPLSLARAYQSATNFHNRRPPGF